MLKKNVCIFKITAMYSIILRYNYHKPKHLKKKKIKRNCNCNRNIQNFLISLYKHDNIQTIRVLASRFFLMIGYETNIFVINYLKNDYDLVIRQSSDHYNKAE